MTAAAIGAGVSRRVSAVLESARRLLVVIDIVIAVLLTVGGLFEVAQLTYSAPAAVGVGSCVVCTASVAIRRPFPFIAALVVTAALAVYQIASKDPNGSFIAPAVVLVYYYLGRSAAERVAWWQLAALLSGALLANALIVVGTGPFSLIGTAGGWLTMALPAACGIAVAHRASLMRRVADATANLRDEQRVRSERALGEERNRVAREVHDVVAHHVSVMVIQTGGARLVAERNPARAEAALQVVEDSGREVLTDLRGIIGPVRREDGPDLAMATGLANLDQLADRARASGVDVDVRLAGQLDRVPAAVDLVAYRLVQEALTNVVKHTRGATAQVSIRVGHHALDISIANTGAASPTPVVPGTGHGLIGMRERVALYGGELSSAHRPGGGFEVHATVPLRSEPIDPIDPSAMGNVVAEQGRRPWAQAVGRWAAALRSRSDLWFGICWLVALEVDAVTDPYRDGPVAVNVAAVAVMAIAFVWRRRAPLLFMLIVGSAAIPLSSGLTSAHSTLVGFYCVTVATFTVAAWSQRSRAIAGLVFWVGGDLGSALATHKPFAGVAGGLIMSCLLWTAGRLWRHQRILAARLAQTQLLLAAERSDRERLAIASERARIARELHVRVAQSVASMIVSVAAARSAIREDTAYAIEVMAAIEQTGRVALARMRDILGVLRGSDTLRQVRPQPGLGQLHAVIQRLRDGGRTVALSVDGDPGPFPAGVDLTAYRIVEAALAEADPRPSHPIAVALRFGDDSVEVDITGSGLQLSAQLRLTVGERAALCNGTVVARTAADRSPRLLVRLPFLAPETVTV